ITSSLINGEEILDNISKNEFLELMNFDSTIFSWYPNVSRSRSIFFRNLDNQNYSPITYIMSLIIDRSINPIKEQFTRELVNHVSPLRAHPQRYYFLDKSNINTVLNTLDGNSLTEILKENGTVRKKVNDWLDKFGLKVDVSTLQDVIHKLKIHQNTLDLDITDVGFGISQILPIIVQSFLSFNGSLTMIEQPEIHLHPKMQADLADLFIDVVNNKDKKYLLIETHSEYLLRRLRRRISEKKISSENIAIYFITPPQNNNSSAEIHEKKVSENGSFEWPQDFYADELKRDTTEFIKHLFLKR
ncbi:AAA family ATPase, partial [Bacteroides sp. An322]|uniref:AAA family ATPase n=1 Tax=Bacteroides sp. An322 TaxID=1965632 RepID=UPI000B554465